MQLVPGRYDLVAKIGKVAKKYVIAIIFIFFYDKWTQTLTENGVFHISKPIPGSFELFPQHSCQVVYHRPPKLPGTGNTFGR